MCFKMFQNGLEFVFKKRPKSFGYSKVKLKKKRPNPIKIKVP